MPTSRGRAGVFLGSILTSRFGADSDIDILVETEPQHPVGILALGGLQMDLTELLAAKCTSPCWEVFPATSGHASLRPRGRWMPRDSNQPEPSPLTSEDLRRISHMLKCATDATCIVAADNASHSRPTCWARRWSTASPSLGRPHHD